MTIEARLEQMKAYREEAMKNPIANCLYIEDLNISIPFLEAQVKANEPIAGKGWVDSEE